MNLLDTFVNAAAPGLSTQITDAKQTAQQVAGVVAGWGAVIVVELAILIFLIARNGGKRG